MGRQRPPEPPVAHGAALHVERIMIDLHAVLFCWLKHKNMETSVRTTITKKKPATAARTITLLYDCFLKLF
jgi:hypothetical protein